jgi:hypothetical protein
MYVRLNNPVARASGTGVHVPEDHATERVRLASGMKIRQQKRVSQKSLIEDF